MKLEDDMLHEMSQSRDVDITGLHQREDLGGVTFTDTDRRAQRAGAWEGGMGAVV